MSLWLPRSQQNLLARLRSKHHLLILTLTPRHNTASVFNHFHPSSRRLQSSKVPIASNSSLSTSLPSDSDPKSGPPAPKDVADQTLLATRLWKKAKHEVAHYWHGTKLLVSEIRISARLQWKILHGETLTRRERRQVRVYSLPAFHPGLADFRRTFVLVEAHHARHSASCAIFCFHHRPLHGVSAPCRAQAIPEYAAIHF
jgi:hypothetical protein